MDDDWRDDFILSSTVTVPAARAALYRGAARGVFARVTRGVYVRTEYWQALDFEGRHLARMRAEALLDPDVVFSHLSAALLHGLPVVGGDLAVPHALSDPAGGGRSKSGLRRHALGMPETVERIGGLQVTPLPQTALHVATAYDAELAVPVLDRVLALGLDREALIDLLAASASEYGAARARWSLGFADERSGSPGESVSRVGFHRLGLPRPELQVAIHDGLGLAGIVDFAWPDERTAGEFDGLGKYLREAFTAGRDPGEVVIAEKRREDRIRATGWRMARWGWDAARSLPSLRRILSDAGLRAR